MRGLPWAESRKVVRCLFFSTDCPSHQFVDVESRRPLDETHHVDCLDTEDWVPNQIWHGVIHDASNNRMVIRRDVLFDGRHCNVTYTCIFRRPHGKNGNLNRAVMALLDHGVEWYDNMLVIAQRESGRVVDMDDERESWFAICFREHMAGQSVDHTFPRPVPVPRCFHKKMKEPTRDSECPGTSTLPIELLWQVVGEASVDSWLTAIAGRGLMRRVVIHVLREKALHDSHGFVFGSVPFSIIFAVTSTPVQLDIAVGPRRTKALIDLFHLLGYESEVARFAPDGCRTAWLLRRGELTIKIHESQVENALTVPIFYTPIAQEKIVLVDRLSSQPFPGDAEIRASVDGNGLPGECGPYCSRKHWTVSSMSGVDRHCAVGDRSKLPVKDGQIVRDLLVLGPPGSETPSLDALYTQQLLMLAELAQYERSRCGLPSLNERDGPSNLIATALHVRLPPKYEPLDPDVRCRAPTEAAMTGIVYENQCLSDYKTEDFEIHTDKLVQQPIYDENRRLVRPWDQYRSLRPGTVVLVTGVLQAYRAEDDISWSFFMSTKSSTTLDVSEWLPSVSKSAGYINLARYTHYFDGHGGREYCAYYEPRNLVNVPSQSMAHVMGDKRDLYPWFGSVLVVGVQQGTICTIDIDEWPSIMACLKRCIRSELRIDTIGKHVAIDALWAMLQCKGGGVVGAVALAVWESRSTLPIRTLELSIPKGTLHSVENWFADKGYSAYHQEVPSEVSDVVEAQKALLFGKVSLHSVPVVKTNASVEQRHFDRE
ncbi:hypothetical protein EYR38_010540 [Pleurotus pulmonarius]|nr:hypothetical protein EYR38_010540 [Pleurotus pulmonarius]